MKCALHSGGCSTCENRKHTEWRDLDGESLQLLEDRMITHLYAPGEVIYHQGDEAAGIYCIKSGLVGERHVNADGNSLLVRLDHPGSTLGYQEFLTRQEHHHTAEVMQTTEACFIDRATIARLLEKNPSIGNRFLQHSLKDTREMEDAYVASATLDVQTRLLHVLLVLCERYGRRNKDGTYTLEIPVAKKDLAELVGTAPESISRTIRKLNKGQLVHINGPTARFPSLAAVYSEISL
ncbi:MAG TPA: Crp/Fnr family transcriptional regulator [Rhizobiales bacterium]|nr:Crp/Fnr family transcriptional regulator [Hyphomicrobiales bacterium]